MKVFMSWSGGLFYLVGSKEFCGGCLSNGEGGGTFLMECLVFKNEVDMEASAWRKVLCGKLWWRGRRGPLVII